MIQECWVLGFLWDCQVVQGVGSCHTFPFFVFLKYILECHGHVQQCLALLLDGGYLCGVLHPIVEGIVQCCVQCKQGRYLFLWCVGYPKQQKLLANVQWHSCSFLQYVQQPIQPKKMCQLTHAHILVFRILECESHLFDKSARLLGHGDELPAVVVLCDLGNRSRS